MSNVILFPASRVARPILASSVPPAPRASAPRRPSPIDFSRITDAQLETDIIVLRRQVDACPGSALSRSLLDQYEREAAWRVQREPA